MWTRGIDIFVMGNQQANSINREFENRIRSLELHYETLETKVDLLHNPPNKKELDSLRQKFEDTMLDRIDRNSQGIKGLDMKLDVYQKGLNEKMDSYQRELNRLMIRWAFGVGIVVAVLSVLADAIGLKFPKAF